MRELTGFWAAAAHHPHIPIVEMCRDHKVDIAAVAEGGPDALEAVGFDHPQIQRWQRSYHVETLGTAIRIIDPGYPDLMKSLQAPPAVLFVEGSPSVLSSRCVAVVGTRNCTAYGAGVAREIARALASHGITVVSGLARGIDAQAHRAAIDAGLSVGVLGCGLAHHAPSSTARLRDDLLERGGCVLSTWVDDTPPKPFQFPIRNRWIVGLCEDVIVIEAPETSGALITATCALEEARRIFAVPGPIGAPASAGPNGLIERDEARLVASVDGLLQSLCGQTVRVDGWIDELVAGQPVEDIATRRGTTVAELFGEIGRLELRGHLVRLPGRRYAKSGEVR